MAYKFQFGTARMSGALEQEGNLTVASGSSDVIGVESTLGSGQFLAQLKYDSSSGVETGILELASGSGDTNFYAGEILSGSVMDTLAGAALDFDQATGIMDVTNTGMAGLISDTEIVVASDSIVYFDATDNTLKRDSLVDYAVKLAAGNGIDASAGSLFLDMDELTAGTISVANDSFAFVDADDNATKKETIADLVTLMVAGDNGLTATSGVISVQTSGAVNLDGDKVGISGSIAGDGLSFAGGVDAISSLAIDLDELTAAAIDVSADSFTFIDANDSNASRKESYVDYATAAAGDGIAASSGQFALDLNELTAAAVDVAADSIAIVDANDSNASRKESIADLVSAMAGAGLAASSGVLSVQANSMNVFTSAGALSEGYNVQNATTAMAMTLPEGSEGDVVVVKAGNLASGAVLTINKHGTQDKQMDGEDSLEIESPFGALTLVYASDAVGWRIV